MRLSKFRKAIADMGCNAAVLTNIVSQRYISRFNFTDGYVVIGREKAAILADFRYIEAAKAAAGNNFEVILISREQKNVLPDTLSRYGAKKVAYENNYITCSAFDALKTKLADFELIPMGNVLDDLREIKYDEEFEAVTRAQRIAEAAFRHVLDLINPEMTEIELAAELEYYMRRAGSDEPAFPTIAVSGASSSLPHGEPANKKLSRGFITMDYGATVDGYRSDMTRTVVLGRADDDMRRLYRTVLDAQLAALEVICEGKDMAEVDGVARDIIENAGYHGCFGHGLGHGVGMYIHEAPSLNPSAKGKILRRGQLVTVEPGIYIEGKYGCRIEDMVALTDRGPVNLTDCEKQLIEL